MIDLLGSKILDVTWLLNTLLHINSTCLAIVVKIIRDSPRVPILYVYCSASPSG